MLWRANEKKVIFLGFLCSRGRVTIQEKLKIAVLPGDGIGIDVTEVAVPVFDALEIPVELNWGDIGWDFWRLEGTPIPTRTWQLIQQADTTLLGAITSKPQREACNELAEEFREANLNYVSPIIQLRQRLDLYANIRPCINLDEETDFNFCVIRENTEGLYAGFDYYPIPHPLYKVIEKHEHWKKIPENEISVSLRLQSKAGLLRLFEFGFAYAAAHDYKRVTLADKPNVLRQSCAFARELFETVAERYSGIEADILNVDAVALWMVRRPEEFGVIIAENMFGDILSDVGAGIMGGLGFSPSANRGEKLCYFEPVHGSAPRIKPGRANPCAMFLTISMLLDHFAYHHAAKKIKQAVKKVIKQRRCLTHDMGGSASTNDMANAIIDQCLKPE